MNVFNFYEVKLINIYCLFYLMLLGSSLRHLCLPWECEDILLSFLTGAFRFRSTVYTELNIVSAAAAAAKSLQSCPTLCNPIDGSSPGSPVPGILQARTLEWAAISFSIAWKWKGKVKSLSRVRLLATPRAAAYQAPPSMGFSRQEYWSGVPSPSLWKGGGPLQFFPGGTALAEALTTPPAHGRPESQGNTT